MKVFAWICLLSFASIDVTDAVISECRTDDHCAAGVCVDEICKCPDGQDFDEYGTRCLDLVNGYGAECESHNQCTGILGQSTCAQKRCVCEDGYVYLAGECVRRASIGATCSNEIACYDGNLFSMKCVDSKCACNENYYSRNGYDCRPIVHDGGNCALDSDCVDPDNVCYVGVCKNENAESKPEPEHKVIASPEPVRNSAATPYNSIGEACSKDTDCTLEHSYCSKLTGTCQCLSVQGYFYLDGKCILGIGSECATSEEASIMNSECTNGRWNCKSEPLLYVSSGGNNRCVKSAFAPKYYCASDDSCKVFRTNYRCAIDSDDEKVCTCVDGYSLNEDFVCLAGSGNDCTNSFCRSQKKNSVCSDSGNCVCPADHVEINNACNPYLEAHCDDSSDCAHIGNAECDRNNVCSCKTGFIPQGNDVCIAASDGLDSACLQNEQCSYAAANSECIDEICQCIVGYMAVDGICYKYAEEMGDYCTNDGVCHVKLGLNVVCRKNECQCPTGMDVTKDGKGCRNTGVVHGINMAILFFSAAVYFYISN